MPKHNLAKVETPAPEELPAEPSEAETPAETPTPVSVGPFYGKTLVLADLGDFSPANPKILALLTFGFKTKLGDARATIGKDAVLPPGTTRESEQDRLSAEMFAKILDGSAWTDGRGGIRGPRQVGLDKFVHEEALRVISAGVARWNAANPSLPRKSLPDGKGAAEKIRHMIDQLRTKPVWQQIEAAAKQAYEASKSPSDDVTSLFD